MAVSKLKNISKSVSKQIRLISERDSVYHLRTNFKKVLPKTSPNYLQYKIHKGWLVSWIRLLLLYVLKHLNALKRRWPLTWQQYCSTI